MDCTAWQKALCFRRLRSEQSVILWIEQTRAVQERLIMAFIVELVVPPAL
jgi:hypothetical protein